MINGRMIVQHSKPWFVIALVWAGVWCLASSFAVGGSDIRWRAGFDATPAAFGAAFLFGARLLWRKPMPPRVSQKEVDGETPRTTRAL